MKDYIHRARLGKREMQAFEESFEKQLESLPPSVQKVMRENHDQLLLMTKVAKRHIQSWPPLSLEEIRRYTDPITPEKLGLGHDTPKKKQNVTYCYSCHREIKSRGWAMHCSGKEHVRLSRKRAAHLLEEK